MVAEPGLQVDPIAMMPIGHSNQAMIASRRVNNHHIAAAPLS